MPRARVILFKQTLPPNLFAAWRRQAGSRDNSCLSFLFHRKRLSAARSSRVFGLCFHSGCHAWAGGGVDRGIVRGGRRHRRRAASPAHPRHLAGYRAIRHQPRAPNAPVPGAFVGSAVVLKPVLSVRLIQWTGGASHVERSSVAAATEVAEHVNKRLSMHAVPGCGGEVPGATMGAAGVPELVIFLHMGNVLSAT